MTQQINLFQPALREPVPLFGARAMVRTLGVVLLGLAVVYAWAWLQVDMLEGEARELARSRDAAEARLTELQTRLPKREQDAALALRLDALEAELDQARMLMAVLSKGAFGNSFGLSPYLVGFARQHVAGTWLTRVEIAEGGSHIGVEGHAQAPELVPVYVQRLAAEPVFDGKVFSQLQLDRAPDEAAVAFALATEGVEVASPAGGADGRQHER
jgi:hypothetical protein